MDLKIYNFLYISMFYKISTVYTLNNLHFLHILFYPIFLLVFFPVWMLFIFAKYIFFIFFIVLVIVPKIYCFIVNCHFDFSKLFTLNWNKNAVQI